MKTSMGIGSGGYRRQKKRQGMAINLVSLMDIFTILVFFLLVNSSDVQVLPSKSTVVLPESVAEEKPRETLVIMLNQQELFVQGRLLGNIAELDKLMQSLKNELDYQRQRLNNNASDMKFVGDVTIMGDKSIPYSLLRQVMLVCSQAQFGNISLAVQQKPKQG